MRVTLREPWDLVEAKKVQPRLLEVFIVELIIRSQQTGAGSGQSGPTMADISRRGPIIESLSLPRILYFTK